MKTFFHSLLFIAVFISAIEVVIARHESRRLFIEIRSLEKERDALNEEWGRIQLEQSTWATNDRIEHVARTKLEMKNPDQKAVVLLAR